MRLAHEFIARDAGFRRHDVEDRHDVEGEAGRHNLSPVTPAKAGVSGRTLMRVLHEMSAFAGMTWEGKYQQAQPSLVTPTEAGVSGHMLMSLLHEMPACAGMT